MQIAFFGSSLLSAYWNGAATYYRGMVRALHQLGHRTTFYEPDAYGRQQHRDIEPPPWAQVVVYDATLDAVHATLSQARCADILIKASGVGVFDELLEAALPQLKTPANQILFWDVDAPATLDRLSHHPADPFHELIPRYDAVFTYGGGDPVRNAYTARGARLCVPIYNALDPQTHFPVATDSRFTGTLNFLGNRLPDREARVEEFFLKPAAGLPHMQFALGGAGWAEKPMPPNIRRCDHVFTADHNAFNSSPRAVLNIARDSMARFGFSPATRVFEAAGAAACVITDYWEGVETFFEPGNEILVARDGDEVADLLPPLTEQQARSIGQAAYRRALAEHTYQHRAQQVEAILEGAETASLAGGRR